MTRAIASGRVREPVLNGWLTSLLILEDDVRRGWLMASSAVEGAANEDKLIPAEQVHAGWADYLSPPAASVSVCRWQAGRDPCVLVEKAGRDPCGLVEEPSQEHTPRYFIERLEVDGERGWNFIYEPLEESKEAKLTLKRLANLRSLLDKLRSTEAKEAQERSEYDNLKRALWQRPPPISEYFTKSSLGWSFRPSSLDKYKQLEQWAILNKGLGSCFLHPFLQPSLLDEDVLVLWRQLEGDLSDPALLKQAQDRVTAWQKTDDYVSHMRRRIAKAIADDFFSTDDTSIDVVIAMLTSQYVLWRTILPEAVICMKRPTFYWKLETDEKKRLGETLLADLENLQQQPIVLTNNNRKQVLDLVKNAQQHTDLLQMEFDDGVVLVSDLEGGHLGLNRIKSITKTLLTAEKEMFARHARYLEHVDTSDILMSFTGDVKSMAVYRKGKPVQPWLVHPCCPTNPWERESYALGRTMLTLLASIQLNALTDTEASQYKATERIAFKLMRGEFEDVDKCLKDAFFK